LGDATLFSLLGQKTNLTYQGIIDLMASYLYFLFMNWYLLGWGSFQYYWCFGSSNFYVTLLSNLILWLSRIYLSWVWVTWPRGLTEFILVDIKAWIYLSGYILLWFSFVLFRVLKLVISNLHLFLLNCGNNYS
jgi:hypothetical protein